MLQNVCEPSYQRGPKVVIPPNDLCSIYFCCNFFCFCFPLFTDKQLIIFGVNIWDFSPLHLLRLAFIVVLVFSASFGPFIAMVGSFNIITVSPSSFLL